MNRSPNPILARVKAVSSQPARTMAAICRVMPFRLLSRYGSILQHPLSPSRRAVNGSSFQPVQVLSR
jgi:hypothetical protein